MAGSRRRAPDSARPRQNRAATNPPKEVTIPIKVMVIPQKNIINGTGFRQMISYEPESAKRTSHSIDSV